MHHRAKFDQNPSNGCGYIAIFQFVNIAAVRYLVFVFRIRGQPIKHIWWSYWYAKFGWNPWSSFDTMKV